MSAAGSVAVVVVTYNRADLLRRMLAGLAALRRLPDEVLVVDNASTDHTAAVLERTAREHPELPLRVLRNDRNTGGAGGFHRGLAEAYRAGHDWIWLMDDDVVPAPDCLDVLLAHARPSECVIAVREDLRGALVEKAATRFDLRNPLAIRPKTASVESTWATRAEMPETTPVENAAFEGFLVHRDVVGDVGLPDPSFFIFYDDVDFVVRARERGHAVRAVRDAVLVRQLEFDQQHALDGWKGYYMYRNLFAVHLRHGENLAVRLKPLAITAAVVLLAPLRGGRREAANVLRALRDSLGMRRLDAAARPGSVSESR